MRKRKNKESIDEIDQIQKKIMKTTRKRFTKKKKKKKNKS